MPVVKVFLKKNKFLNLVVVKGNLSLSKFAKRAHISQSTMYNITNDRHGVSGEVRNKILKYFERKQIKVAWRDLFTTKQVKSIKYL